MCGIVRNHCQGRAIKHWKTADEDSGPCQRKQQERSHLAELRKMKICELEKIADADPDAPKPLQ